MNTLQILYLSDFKDFLQKRPRDSHKGLFGHVLVVGGDVGFSGAVRMAAEAALRVGAGLVSIATRKSHADFLNVTRPEIMCHGVESEEELTLLLEKATVIIVGPGLQQSSWAKKCLSAVLNCQKPLVVDADGLNLLAVAPQKYSSWILTPHPMEAARLLQCDKSDIQADRLNAAIQLQQKYDGVIVLKGAGTLIVGKAPPAICVNGNPGMSSAGMGDILSGVIGGLVAQQIPLEVAAKLGVLVHALAGDCAAENGERGLIATDLFPYLKQLVNV